MSLVLLAAAVPAIKTLVVCTPPIFARQHCSTGGALVSSLCWDALFETQPHFLFTVGATCNKQPICFCIVLCLLTPALHKARETLASHADNGACRNKAADALVYTLLLLRCKAGRTCYDKDSSHTNHSTCLGHCRSPCRAELPRSGGRCWLNGSLSVSC